MLPRCRPSGQAGHELGTTHRMCSSGAIAAARCRPRLSTGRTTLPKATESGNVLGWEGPVGAQEEFGHSETRFDCLLELDCL